jgi:hypothetical protein
MQESEKPFFIFALLIAIYPFLWTGFILLKDPQRIKKDPFWRLSFAPVTREFEDIYLRHSKPLGVIGICIAVFLIVVALVGLVNSPR